MSRRFSAYNFSGRPCNVCGFPAALLYVEVCKMCYGSLLHCPKCSHVDCYGTRDGKFRLAWWRKEEKKQ